MIFGDDDRQLFGGRASPPPSPGPWRVRETRRIFIRHEAGYDRVFVVLDANDKCVAECERAEDADYIAKHGPVAFNEIADAREVAQRAELDTVENLPGQYDFADADVRTLVGTARQVAESFARCHHAHHTPNNQEVIYAQALERRLRKYFARTTARKAGG